MIGDGGKRKRAAKPTAQEALAEAERRLQEARQHLATLRHHARLAHHDQAELQQQVESELRRAGLELRPPNGVEQLQNEANQKGWELHQFQQRIAGAGPAVVQAEERRDTALLATYPQRAAELDRAEEKLVSRRERLEREQAELEQLENDHRAAWRKLLGVIPGGFATTFVPREFLETRHSQGIVLPETLGPTWRPELDQGMNPDLTVDPAWPAWLRDAVEKMQTRLQRPDAPITQTPATFEDATPVPATDDRDFAEMIQRARASDRAADANTIEM
jgi:hypothetical protein